MNFELPCVHVAPKKDPPFLDTRARMRPGKLLQPEEGCQLLPATALDWVTQFLADLSQPIAGADPEV